MRMDIHWLEFKLLDKSTNHPSRTQMIRELSRIGHRVRYFCGHRRSRPVYGLGRGVINYLGRPVRSRFGLGLLLAGLLTRVFRSLFGKGPDILMIDYSINLAAFPILFLSRALRKRPRIVLDVRTIPVNLRRFQLQHAVFLFSLRLARLSCHGISFITPFMRDVYRARIGLDPKRSISWTSGVDPALFDPDRYPEREGKEDFILFYHGGISLSRGIGSLIQAVGILRARGKPVKLELIGNLVNREEIESLIDSAGGEEVCRLHAPVPHTRIPAWIKAADLPVIPLPGFFGWRVSSPIKLMEYMAMGKCMVLTPIEAHRHVAGDAAWAYFSAGSSPEQLADAVEEAFQNREKLEIQGREARKLARRDFTWKAQAGKLAGFLETV